MPPVNCRITWGPWGECNEGKKFRYATITTRPEHGGTACPTLNQEKECVDYQEGGRYYNSVGCHTNNRCWQYCGASWHSGEWQYSVDNNNQYINCNSAQNCRDIFEKTYGWKKYRDIKGWTCSL